MIARRLRRRRRYGFEFPQKARAVYRTYGIISAGTGGRDTTATPYMYVYVTI